MSVDHIFSIDELICTHKNGNEKNGFSIKFPEFFCLFCFAICSVEIVLGAQVSGEQNHQGGVTEHDGIRTHRVCYGFVEGSTHIYCYIRDIRPYCT